MHDAVKAVTPRGDRRCADSPAFTKGLTWGLTLSVPTWAAIAALVLTLSR